MNIQRDIEMQIHRRDLPEDIFQKLVIAGPVACDIETTGLNWRKDKICTVQFFSKAAGAHLVQIEGGKPNNICRLLEDAYIAKVFHHALFDLRFMAFAWGAEPRNILCTKIASKISNKGLVEKHSLGPLLKRHLNVELDKTLQKSDWCVQELSVDQVDYAIGDVIYLDELLSILMNLARETGRTELILNAFAFLPVKVKLDVGEFDDVFSY